MRRILQTGLFASLLFATFTSSAAITAEDSTLVVDGSTMIRYTCVVKQTAGPADHSLYPGGKKSSCVVNGSDKGYNWCSTNHPGVHYCSFSSTHSYANPGTYTLTTQAYGVNGGDIAVGPLVTRGLGCMYVGVCIPF